MTKLEAALLKAISAPSMASVVSMTLDFKPNRPPYLQVELFLLPPTLDGLDETVFKRFKLVEIPEEEPAA